MRTPSSRIQTPRRKLTILVVTGGLGIGGSEQQLMLVLSALSKSEAFDLHVLVLNHDRGFVLNEVLEASGVRIWMVPVECESKLQRLRFVYATARRIRPDIIHSWMFYANAYVGIVGVLTRAKGSIGSLRSLLALAEEKVGRAMGLISLFSVPHLIVNSKAAESDVIAAGYPAGRVTLLENCIDFEAFVETAEMPREIKDLGIREDDIVVGAVGNLRPEKDHHLLVQAVAQLVQSYPRIRAVIVGVAVVPGVQESLLDQIRRAGVQENVTLAGFRADVPALMRRFDVFCITSRSEGSPNVLLEAMASGRPIVATSVGGILELIQDGVNGLLIPPGDANRLADAIRAILDDPTLAARLGPAGRTLAESRTCARSAARLGELYQQLAG